MRDACCVYCAHFHQTYDVSGLVDNNIGVLGAQSIGESLKSLTTLNSLNLSGKCCVCVMHDVCYMPLSICLWCSENNIEDAGAQSIGDGLKLLTSMTFLSLYGGKKFDCVIFGICCRNYVCDSIEIQRTRLETSVQSRLVMVSSYWRL